MSLFKRIAAITLVLLALGSASAQDTPTPAETSRTAAESPDNWACIKDINLARHAAGTPVWLSSSDLTNRITEKTPIAEPCCARSNLRGIVTVDIALNVDGSVKCVRALKGHPIAISSVVAAVRRWKFRPYVVKGRPTAVLGRLKVPYDFRSSGGSAGAADASAALLQKVGAGTFH